LKIHPGVGVEAGFDTHPNGAYPLMRLADSIGPMSGKPLGRFYREGALAVDRRLLLLGDVPDELPVYVADAISEYFFAQNAQETWDVPTDFPGCLPPHSDLFLELGRPSRVRSEAFGVRPSSAMPRYWGWFLSRRDRREVPLEQRAERARQFRDQLLEAARKQIDANAVDSALSARNPVQASLGMNETERRLIAAKTLAGEPFTVPARGLPARRPSPAPGWLLWATLVSDYGELPAPTPSVTGPDLDRGRGACHGLAGLL
jgi:hypothetical protein